MIPLLLFAAIHSVSIPGADLWSLAKNDDQPFCFAERRASHKVVAITYSAIEDKSSILFAVGRSLQINIPNGAKMRVFLSSNNSSTMRELKGYDSFRVTSFENDAKGIIFEWRLEGYLERLRSGDRLSVFAEDKMIVSVDTPNLPTAVAATVRCSRNAKTRFLEAL